MGENFYLSWESQLAGPKQASAWSGSSLHTTTSVTGAQIVPINVQQITPILTASLELQKTASTPIANPGDNVSYTFTVTNTGNYAFSNVVVTDPMFGSTWSHSVGALAVSARATFTTTYTIPITAIPGSIVNTATAIGTYTSGTASDTDDEAIVVQTVITDIPSIDIHKTVDPVQVKAGDTVTYSIHVTNTGNVDLTNVTVTDPLFGADWSYVIDTLQSGQIVWIYVPFTVPANATAGILVNIVSVTGDYPSGQVSAHADASLNNTGSSPTPTAGVELTKVAVNETANPGDTITYHFTVKNTGTYELTDLIVTDPLFGES